MTSMSGVVQQLRKERERAQGEVQRIDEARARWAKQKATPKRTISAAGRKRIAAAQRARWAKVKREQKAA